MQLGTINTLGATVGQVFTFDWSAKVPVPSLTQQSQGIADTIIIYNQSPCVFNVTLEPSGRAFTLPAGAPTTPIPGSYRGTQDTSVKFLVAAIALSASINSISIDWFGATEPVLSSAPMGSIGLGAVSSISVAGHDNWVIAEDPAGNLYFQDITTGIIAYVGRNDARIIYGIAVGVSANNQAYATYSPGTNEAIFQTPQNGPANAFTFNVWSSSALVQPFSVGNGGHGISSVKQNGDMQPGRHIQPSSTTPSLGALQAGISSQSIVGSDAGGTITLTTTGAGPPGAGGTVALLTFANAYPATPSIVLTAANGILFYWFSGSASGFSFGTTNALSISTTYFINYVVIGI